LPAFLIILLFIFLYRYFGLILFFPLLMLTSFYFFRCFHSELFILLISNLITYLDYF
jgi:hypothetical protein